MKLPNAETAYIPPSKLADYLLSTTHPIGRSKAQFFRAVGFDERNVDELEQHLLILAQVEEVKEAASSEYGTKFIIEGSFEAPSGTRITVRTVWILETGQDQPRFVTAYPA